ncbi:MAG: DUF47 family protein [bacterium]|nr:DUF47 family protein [bacterium]
MLNKYFGLLKVQDEYSVMESLLEHIRIDEEEIELLEKMVDYLCCNNLTKVEEYYNKIKIIMLDSNRIFESISEQIIQAQFDQQKQYDLLRLYQRIEGISQLIIASAKRILILDKIEGKLPDKCIEPLKKLMHSVVDIHIHFQKAVSKYIDDRTGVMDLIKSIEEKENHIDHLRSECLKTLYLHANTEPVPLGDFRAIENIVEHIEDLSDAIELAATSLEWLLIY